MINSIFRTTALLSLLWLPVAGLLAQQGTWKATTFKGGIVKLQWQHPTLARAEYMGDAVIAKPTSATIQLKPTTAIKMGASTTAKQFFPAEDIGSGPVVNLTNNGLKVLYPNLAIELVKGYDSSHHRGFLIRMQPNDRWYGGGERSLPLLRNGQRIPLNNAPHYGYELNAAELNYSVPFIFTTNGYGLLFDNPSKGFFDIGKSNPTILQAGFESGELNVYVIPGENPAAIIQNFTALTGRQPLPPRWALGNFVSRFGYRSQAQVEDVIRRMKTDSFAVDAVVIDIFWFGDSIKGTLGNLDWMNKKKWPNPNEMMANFRNQHINTILVTEPFLLKGTKNFEASKPFLATTAQGQPYMLTQFYFGYGGLLDLFKPQARQWFWQFYKKQTDNGVAGWWGDLGEPENHPADVYHNMQSFGIQRPVAAGEIHNLYGHMWSKMLFENWQKTYPGQRLFYLNRAGFAGSQRYSVFPWTGDVSRTWNGLKAQLPNLQSMSLSGLPFVHSDAGGFSNVPENDQELYVRWLQMAGFTPVFRPHATAFGDLEPGVNDLPSEPTFKDEPYKSIARQVIRQRYQLLPYLYSMAWQQTNSGSPLIRPMLYSFPDDSSAANATAQYMFGDALLVAPVTDKGARQQAVYLPEGTWYHLHNGEKIIEKGWQTLAAPLEQMPVLVQAGSLVPVWKEGATAGNTVEYTPATPLEIRYFAGSSAQPQWLYDDDGNNPKALQQKQAHQLLRMQAIQNAKQHQINFTPFNWPAGTRRSFSLLPIGLTGQVFTVSVNGRTMKRLYTPGESIPLVFAGQPVTIQIVEQ